MQSHGLFGFAFVLPPIDISLAEMSLNRCEQYLYDFVLLHKEEGQFWRQKVQSAARLYVDPFEAAQVLEGDLWRYYSENNVPGTPFHRDNPVRDDRRTSMKNLAEYLLRLWVNLPRKKAGPG